MMRYPANIANRPSRRLVIRVQAKRERGGAHRRAVARGAISLPSDQRPVAAGGEFAQRLVSARAHSRDSRSAMPLGEAIRNHRRVDRTGTTRNRLTRRKRQLGIIRQSPFVAVRYFNRWSLSFMRDAHSVANCAAKNATENLVSHKSSSERVGQTVQFAWFPRKT